MNSFRNAYNRPSVKDKKMTKHPLNDTKIIKQSLNKECKQGNKSKNVQNLFGDKPPIRAKKGNPSKTITKNLEKLLRSLQSLEDDVTDDTMCLKAISDIPLATSDINLILESHDSAAGHQLAEKVNSALLKLEAYNKRLHDEILHRKQITQLLHNHIKYQKNIFHTTGILMEEYHQKLTMIKTVQYKLKTRLHTFSNL